ncbi:MAG: bifunctional folylpolyglutamate synthase/dihydrofolate synthase, partial [Peptococcaceae bacterium]|nr:bifunctional folylpolyglutamate synthase/dihydrofolate synthase [Peptococcaceae bacterium]
MDYQESLSYIEQLNTKGIALGLARIAALLDLLGNPQEDVRCIHVAGTNGKGSVCAFMDSAMQLAGLRVGRYISPTLDAYLERFQINGTYIDKQEFAEILTEVR